jgi:hypothetical protein
VCEVCTSSSLGQFLTLMGGSSENVFSGGLERAVPAQTVRGFQYLA